ncbi:MAG: primosomal protein N', partial [Patescibacteria group bacterium]
ATSLFNKNKLNKKANTTLINFSNPTSKLEVLKKLINQVLTRKQSALLLVPTKAQANNLAQKLTEFKPIIFTADLKTSAIRQIYNQIISGEINLLIGTRSALFLPFQNLGGVIVNDPADINFKQYDQNPRYSVIQVAKWLAELHSAPLAYVSASNPLELWYEYYKQAGAIKNLKSYNETNTTLVDLRHDRAKNFTLSDTLIEQINSALKNSGQIFLYLNKLGDATGVTCRDCGYSARCQICDRALVFQADSNKLVCFHCQTTTNSPLPCPKCRGLNIKFLSGGLGNLSKEIKILWPDEKLANIQSDDENIVRKISEAKIIISSQPAPADLDFSQVNLIGVILADITLKLPEFRATEITWTTLRGFQTSGASKLTIQTYSPEHYVLQSIYHNQPSTFYNQELLERTKFKYPPLTELLRLTCQNTSEIVARQEILELKKILQTNLPREVNLTGPYPDYFKQVRGRFRFHLLLRYSEKTPIEKLWPYLPPEVIIDRNPYYVLS